MKRMTAAIAVAMAGLGGLALAGTLGPADDDLTVIKKAVARPAAKATVTAQATTAPAQPTAAAPLTETRQAATPAAASTPRPLARSGREPQWFKVRVVDKASGRKKVTINLPLSLVRAIGDEPIDWGCRDGADRERCRTVKLSDVLQSLDTGQELVEIEDEEATVRVWVE
jgi:hypothetical protein